MGITFLLFLVLVTFGLLIACIIRLLEKFFNKED